MVLSRMAPRVIEGHTHTHTHKHTHTHTHTHTFAHSSFCSALIIHTFLSFFLCVSHVPSVSCPPHLSPSPLSPSLPLSLSPSPLYAYGGVFCLHFNSRIIAQLSLSLSSPPLLSDSSGGVMQCDVT